MAVLRGTGHRPPRHEARRPREARTAAEAGRGRAAHRLHPAPAQAAHRPAYTARPAHPAPADGQRSTGRTRTRSQALFGLHPRREAPAYVCHPPDRARPGSPRYPGRRRQGPPCAPCPTNRATRDAQGEEERAMDNHPHQAHRRRGAVDGGVVARNAVCVHPEASGRWTPFFLNEIKGLANRQPLDFSQ